MAYRPFWCHKGSCSGHGSPPLRSTAYPSRNSEPLAFREPPDLGKLALREQHLQSFPHAFGNRFCGSVSRPEFSLDHQVVSRECHASPPACDRTRL